MTIVGKTWTLQVTDILRTTLDENLAMIEDSALFLTTQGREVVYDAEHFFDATRPTRTTRCARSPPRSRAAQATSPSATPTAAPSWTISRPSWRRVVAEFGADRVGVHCHNDSGLGVALSLAGVGRRRDARAGHDQTATVSAWATPTS